MKKTTVSKQPLAEQLHDPGISVLTRYRLKVLGDESFSGFVRYELANFLFGNMPGGAGYALRKWSLKKLFRKSGAGLILGRGISFRHPGKISFGDRVAIDDYCLIDASGAGNHGIIMEDDVIISRNCVIQGKTGPVSLGKRTDIGCNTIISSVTGISIGSSVLIAGNCYIGGARYNIEKTGLPVMDQGIHSRGPVSVGDNSWLGANVTVLDGINIGKGCVVGAGAVVTKNLPDYSIAIGAPAKVVQTRKRV